MATTLCVRMLRDTAAAEDAVQEATITAWHHLDRLRKPDQFGAWLAGIALNICRSWLRYRARDEWTIEVLAGGRALDRPRAEESDPAELAAYHELIQTLHRAVAELPAGQREAVTSYYLEGLTQVEVAVALGTSTAAVKTRLAKARRTLRRRLELIGDDVSTIDSTDDAVPVDIVDLWRMPARTDIDVSPLPQAVNAYVVVLREREGERRLAIWVGEHEGITLALVLEKTATPRPLTHSMVGNLLTAAGAKIRRVVVSQLIDRTYHAAIELDTSDGTRTVDARPSDALILAAQAKAPIAASNAVLESATQAHADRFPLDAIEEKVDLRGSSAIIASFGVRGG